MFYEWQAKQSWNPSHISQWLLLWFDLLHVCIRLSLDNFWPWIWFDMNFARQIHLQVFRNETLLSFCPDALTLSVTWYPRLKLYAINQQKEGKTSRNLEMSILEKVLPWAWVMTVAGISAISLGQCQVRGADNRKHIICREVKMPK